MDISKIGVSNHYTNISKVNRQDNRAKDLNQNQTINREMEEIEAGCLVEITPVDEKQKAYEGYYLDYIKGITNGQGFFHNQSLEDMYKYSLDQFDAIENSTDDEETKAMRRVALEMAVKNSTEGTVKIRLTQSYNIDIANAEKDKNVMANMRAFQYNQHKAISDSVRKLTLNFLDYVKNNKGNDFDAMLNYVNKNATSRDANNLSTSGVSGFFDYAKNSNYVHTQSNADADFYKGYFNTVSDGVDKSLDNKWERTAFDNEIYQKYAKYAFYKQ